VLSTGGAPSGKRNRNTGASGKPGSGAGRKENFPSRGKVNVSKKSVLKEAKKKELSEERGGLPEGEKKLSFRPKEITFQVGGGLSTKWIGGRGRSS